MLEPPQVPVFGDGDTSFRAKPWQAPRHVPEDVRREAINALGVRNTLKGEVQVGHAERFVAHLANMCAGRDLPPETKLQAAVSAILRGGYPAVMFLDPGFLDRAARKFAFWPSWSELAPILDEERDRVEIEGKRLQVIARGGAQNQPKATDKSDENEPWTGPRSLSAETDALMKQWRSNPPPGPELLRPRPAATGPSGRSGLR